jgi:hypothetical protein
MEHEVPAVNETHSTVIFYVPSPVHALVTDERLEAKFSCDRQTPVATHNFRPSVSDRDSTFQKGTGTFIFLKVNIGLLLFRTIS